MTIQNKIAMVRSLTNCSAGEDTDALISAYLGIAEADILRRRYPFGTDGKTMPTQYDILQVKLACRYFFRAGAEGEISHNENGLNRTYETVDDDDILSQIVPIVKVGG